MFSNEVTQTLRSVCLDIAMRFEVHCVEIGSDEDHVHFLIQSVPVMLPKRIAQIMKSITAREIFRRHPEVKKKLLGGEFWTKGYYVNTVGKCGNETMIANYVKNQGGTYAQIHRAQLSLFEGVE